MRSKSVVSLVQLILLAGASALSAQTTTPPSSGPLELACGLRYQVIAGAGTALYDPARTRRLAHPLTWDQLERFRYPRTVRSAKDLPSQVSPTRRIGGFEGALWAIEGVIHCPYSWGGRAGSVSFTLDEVGTADKPGKGRSVNVFSPATSCTYSTPNFERLKDFNREFEAKQDSPGYCGTRVRVIGYGFFPDSTASLTSKNVGTISGQISPVLDIEILDEDGNEKLGTVNPDPKEAFIANMSFTARVGKTQENFRMTQRDGVWIVDGFGAKNAATPIPSGIFLNNNGHNPLKNATAGISFGFSMNAPLGKQLTPGGYLDQSTLPADRRAFLSFGGAGKSSGDLVLCFLPVRETFTIGRQRWDCFDKTDRLQQLHLVELQSTFTQQCERDDPSGWSSITGRVTYIAPEQVPCQFTTTGINEEGSNWDGTDDPLACPEGTDPADCPDEVPYEPGPPPEDPPVIGLPGAVKAHPLVLANGESNTMRLTVVTLGDADVDLAVSSEPEGLVTSLSKTFIPLPGSGVTNLTVTANDDAPLGDYVVHVSATNVGLTATESFGVRLSCDPPTILGIDQPQSMVVEHGTSATLQAKPGGSGPYKYQWYNGYSGMTFDPIPGANGATFTTPALNATSTYWVRVSNACGTVDSNTATVTVH